MEESFNRSQSLPSALVRRVDPRYSNFAPWGWWPILERLHERLLDIDPDYRVDQVKEKWGLLCIYLEADTYADRPQILDRIQVVIKEAVQESAITCERCGEPGRLRNDKHSLRLRHYQLTHCDRCVPVERAEWKRRLRAFIAEFIEGDDGPT